MDDQREASRAIWNEMAAGWKTFNDYLWDVSRPVGEWMVEHLEPHPGQTILDVAAGPGDTGFVAAKLIGDDGRLICTDFAAEMVEVARGRAQHLGITNAEFRQMDAERMDLDGDSVDGVLCRWGLMLMQDPDAAARETRRVLRDGGRFAFATWGGPQDNPWVTVLGMVMVQEGYPPQGDPFGPGGMFSLATHDRIRALVTSAGFTDVEIVDVPVIWRYEDFDEAWVFMSQVAGVLAALLKTLDADQTARVRAALEEAVQAYTTPDGIRLPGVSVAALAC